jgi:hypothetical protein
MISDYSYIISVDVANKYDIGACVYDLKSHQIMMYDGQAWKFVNTPEDKFQKRKRIISKLLSENNI